MPAKRLVRQFLEALGKDDMRLLKRRLSLDDEQLDDVIRLIRSLDPRPGSTYGVTDDSYITPDLVVRHDNEGWHLELNPEALPRLRIQPDYASLIKHATPPTT